MSTAKVQIIRCDRAHPRPTNPTSAFHLLSCAERFVGDEFEPIENIRARAKAAGWVRAGAWDYCPRHGGR